MSGTLERLKQYIDNKGISIRAFEMAVGFSNGAFASQLKNKKTIGVDKLENILHVYPELNANWLLTGRNEMLLSSATNAQAVAEPSENYSHSLQDVIQLQKEMIEVQKDLITELKQKLGKEKAARGRTG